MKLQLLYVFILAAPLLVRVLSPEAPPAAVETAETPAAKVQPVAAPAKAPPTPCTAPAKKSKKSSARHVPAPHAYTFM